MNKLWLKSKGSSESGAVSLRDHEAVYDCPIPHTNSLRAQAGIRAGLESDPYRAWAGFGVEGLTPCFSKSRQHSMCTLDVAGRAMASTDLLLAQKQILLPQAELNVYSKDDRPLPIGSEFSDIDTGVRLRYEIRHKFASYIGFANMSKFGNTAGFPRRAGRPRARASSCSDFESGTNAIIIHSSASRRP
jgi:copper resistance protein B